MTYLISGIILGLGMSVPFVYLMMVLLDLFQSIYAYKLGRYDGKMEVLYEGCRESSARSGVHKS